MQNESPPNFIRKSLKTISQAKDAVSQISEYLECQFIRRTSSKIYQILHLFVPIGAQ